ncbi:hypothetical protein HPB51_002314 [Rhipicephalus microplus]|uniref:Uncharacterized protein n=1 Tax=Rhipicephalus microplus TaxID=6941 RepID=A0A9J6DST9_RHIMP|nr:hypothetical protein HPB51_002314 [Rhipicephalus microplus]
MAGAKFQYDESGGTFFYFLLSFLAPVVIPCTYYFWPKDERAADSEKKGGRSCRCPQCVDKSRRLRVNQPWRRTKQNIVRVLLVLGWVAMAATAYKCHLLILRRVITVLAASLEFEKSHNLEIMLRPADDVEIPALIKMLPNFNEKNSERPLCYEYSIKARALLYAHMLRIPLSPGLDEDRCYIL